MRKGLTGNIKHSNGLLKYGYKRNSELRNIKRRLPKPGYPKDFIFTDKKEVELYFSGDRITCLMCGHNFKALGSHLDLIHGMSTDDYKTKYGLPYRKGLIGVATNDKFKRNMEKKIQDGSIDMSPEIMEEYRKKSHLKKPRPYTKYRRNISLMNINKSLNKKNLSINPNSEKVWNDSDYYKVLELAEKNKCMPTDIMANKDYKVPKRSSFQAKFQIDEILRKRYYEVIDNLPAQVQTKHHMIGNVLKSKLKELRDKFYTNQQIADELNISLGSVINIVAEMNLPRKIKKYCYRGHLYPENKRKCDECATILRRQKGVLTKKEAGKTTVEKNCYRCGKLTETKKMGKCCCQECRKLLYDASQKKYNENNRKRRSEMARIARLKRIAKGAKK